MIPSHLEYEALMSLPIEKRSGYQPLPEDQRNQRLVDITEQMSQHAGELFLVTTKRWELVKRGWSGCFGGVPDQYLLDEENALGVVTEPFVSQENVFLRFYTPHKVVIGNMVRERGGVFADRNPDIGPTYPKLYANALEAPLERRDRLYGENPGRALDVMVGDQVVLDHVVRVAAEGKMNDFDKMQMKILKEEDPQKYEEARLNIFNPDTVLRFQRMQEALGRTALFLPQEILELMEVEMRRRKEEVFKSVEELEIGKVRGWFSGVDIIRRAIELGLHQEERIIQREVVPGKVMVIDVPVYVQGMAEKYQVDLPKKSS